ncbi:helix-turn-helix domain-containing protein [Pseudoalteromonas piscicida]|uniref:AraC family transcriptional regulator n=1 Tax=Pseudoalteromonas piscicida TaxID=43662 RepID=A0A2A5JUA2_PSEO7|nr:helix-turn-helix domain-containing protein [Pseudoalteromonas piscicida]PCK33062.1 AraC family transcriptional regulator [Pseudoalteromonas piscicida]
MSTFECHTKQLASRYFALPLVELAAQRGVHCDIILKGSKLFYDDLHSTQMTISFAQFETIVSNLCTQANCQEVSFIYGQYLLNTLVSHHAELLFNCRSILQLLKILMLKGLSIMPLYHFRKLHTQDTCHLLFSSAIAESTPVVTRFLCEMMASLICGYLKWRSPDTLLTLQFPYAKPKAVAQYLSHIHLPHHFEHSDFAVVMDTQVLTQRQKGSFPHLVNRQLQALPTPARGFLAQLHRLQLKYPKYHSEQIAAILGVSAATFKRKLKLHNTTFINEKDRLNRQQAMFYVTEQGYSNEQVANALQFNDITNFRRAFKRWTGLTPSYFRKT